MNRVLYVGKHRPAPVCPTYVGMNRKDGFIKTGTLGMPHVCGDEPGTYYFSLDFQGVCPTYVGMNRAGGHQDGF